MDVRTDAILGALEGHPRVGLSCGPAPIHALPRLSAGLGREVWAMRDDLTGFALGGNKVRKLEFLVGHALATGADTMVVAGASSFSRNAAAAGRAHGVEVHVLALGPERAHNAASRAFFDQLEAHVHPIADGASIAREQEQLVASLRAAGRRVVELHPGGSDAIGTLGYVDAAAELCAWSDRHDLVFDAIYLATGSAATQAGLVLGLALGRYPARVVGVAVSQPTDVQRARVAKLVGETAARLDLELDAPTVLVDDRYLGDGYPIPSPASRAATDRFAREEGLLLDPVYTGKAAAALVDHAARGELRSGERALFLHTGGNAGLYY